MKSKGCCSNVEEKNKAEADGSGDSDMGTEEESKHLELGGCSRSLTDSGLQTLLVSL